MTPTEQDKELGAIRQKLYVYLSEAFPDRHFDEEQFEQWLDTRKEFVDTAMQLITNLTRQHEKELVEARVDELEDLSSELYYFGDIVKVDKRIAELKAQQEEV